MDHPVIAKVFDDGTMPQGRPYFAMEYVKGEPITACCDRHRLSTVERSLPRRQSPPIRKPRIDCSRTTAWRIRKSPPAASSLRISSLPD
jgi:hypothetical protein